VPTVPIILIREAIGSIVPTVLIMLIMLVREAIGSVILIREARVSIVSAISAILDIRSFITEIRTLVILIVTPAFLLIL
jgi:hypothetical protein